MQTKKEISRTHLSRAAEVVLRPKDTLNDGASFVCNMDGLWEISHATFKFTALADGAVCDPQPTILDRFIGVRGMDLYRGLTLGDLSLLAIEDAPGTFVWTPLRTLELGTGQGIGLTIDARDSFDIAIEGRRKRIDAIRVEIVLEGELVKYAAEFSVAKSTFAGEGQPTS